MVHISSAISASIVVAIRRLQLLRLRIYDCFIEISVVINIMTGGDAIKFPGENIYTG